MDRNAAQADRAWERLHRRGWKCTLANAPDGQLPWFFLGEKNDVRITTYGTTRVDAVLLGARNVENAERSQVTA